MEPQTQPRNNSRPEARLELRPEVKVRSVSEVYDNNTLQTDNDNGINWGIILLSIIVVVALLVVAMLTYPPTMGGLMLELLIAILLGGALIFVFRYNGIL